MKIVRPLHALLVSRLRAKLMVRITLLLLFISSAAIAEQESIQTYSHTDLVGKWFGKWDGIYPMEVEVIKNGESYEITYRYEEIVGEPLKEIKDRGIPINKNTIQVGTIYITVDQFRASRVTAVGLFSKNTRISKLKPNK